MRRTLRLLAVTDSTELGGAELCLGLLLAELDPGIEVAVAGEDARIVGAIAAHRPGTATAVVAPGDVRAHARTARAWRADVVHVNRAHLLAGEAATVGGLLVPGAAVVAVEHLPHAFDVPRRALWRRRWLNRRLAAHASVGERAARMVEEALGSPAGSVTAVANGVPPVRVEPVERPAGGTLVGSVGRLTEQKGLDALVTALTALPQSSLVLVGDGPERPALEALAATLGVADRLTITGWTDSARRWLPVLDVVAIPSRWEGLPLGVLEAMHAGRPVVATDVGSVSEAVRDGETGYVVALRDQPALEARLARLVADPELRERLGAQGRLLAGREFTAAAMARRYEALYLRAVEGRVRRPANRSRTNPV